MISVVGLGQYDEGMLEWGGENLEQSIRAWMCGGEIVASHESKIGHIFARPPKPNPENRLVIQVKHNNSLSLSLFLGIGACVCLNRCMCACISIRVGLR